MATTVNVHDGDDVTASVSPASDLTGISISSVDQNIGSFLERPIMVSSFSWTTSQAIASSVYELDLDAAFAAAGPTWWAKLQGFGLLKATMVITFQLNASRMNSGALLAYFMPAKAATPELYSARPSMISKSQLPSAIIDAQQHEMTFDLPYMSPFTHYDLQKKGSQSPWGSLGVAVYSVLRNGSSGTNTADCVVWMSFKDIELSMPVVAQSGRGRFKARPHPSEQELGPVSKTLKAVSVMASSISSIPTLTSIAGPVSWFTNALAGAASAFGWSKPVDDGTGSKVIISTHAGSQNVNGVDHSHSLALTADNKVRVIPDLGLGVDDELSINFIKTQWSYFRQFQWSVSDNVSAKLSTVYLAPYEFGSGSYTTVSTAPAKSVFHVDTTPVAFLACLFTHYRGGFCLRFRIPKTDLHTGRLMVSYLPGLSDTTDVTMPATVGLNRHIIDVQDGGEFCLEFPHLVADQLVEVMNSIGSVQVFVVNPLRCPATVSQVLDVIVEVRGLDELEFHIPSRKHAPYPIVPQSGMQGQTSSIIEASIGSTSSAGMSSVAEYNTGEKILSLLQLLKRYYKLTGRYEASMYNVDVSRTRSINPFATNALLVQPNNLVLPAVGLDLLPLFASCYLFNRGGVRLRFVSVGAKTQYAYWLDAPSYNNTYESSDDGVKLWDQTGVSDMSRMMRAGHMSPCLVDNNHGGFSVQVPSYCPSRARYNKIPVSRGTVTKFDSNLMVSWSAIPDGSTQTSATRPMHIFRSCADDFQLSVWLGTPRLALLAQSNL